MTGDVPAARGAEADVVVVVPVHRNADTLVPLFARLRSALDPVTGGAWRLRLVLDACPEGSAIVARRLAALDPRVAVTELDVNVGQNAALALGLLAEEAGQRWVVMDADLQDPPEAVPALLEELDRGAVDGVFGGRRGDYEPPLRRATGTLHRWVMRRLTGLPADAGAFFAMDAALRAAVLDAVVERDAPSVVAAAGRSGLALASTPVTRAVRAAGTSSWTHRARARQARRTLAWAFRDRLRHDAARCVQRAGGAVASARRVVT